MTIRVPVSTIQNNWNDAQRVDKQDIDTEQDHKNQNDASIINNHFGSGILPLSPTQNIIFDSDSLTAEQAALVASNDFDGTGVDAHTQPSDSNLGNQLEVELSGSDAFGRLSVKVLIVGVDFEGNSQYDRFTFYTNEKQVTRKHYARILGIFFNDFKGNNNCSRTLGGRIVIREAASYELSRDTIMVAQDVEPNLFFRDYKTPNQAVTLYNTLQAGIGSEFSVDSLDINTTVKIDRNLVANDVSTRIGQKFKADTNNIQKITLLLGAGRDDSVDIENRFDWAGDLVITVYELQTTVNCPTDIVPELAIEFEPDPTPLAQLTFSQAELYDLGYVLTDVLQPVDFIFSSTQLGSATNPILVPGRFYAVTINRAGAATSGMIITGVGNDKIADSRLTIFSGGTWADVVEEDLWFQIWTDAAKVADGQAYDAGNGIQIDKTEVNEQGITVDFALKAQAFADTGANTLNTAVVEAVLEESVEEQDERTGNPVNARQKFEPQFSFVTSAGLDALEAVGEPLIIGCAEDTNPKQNPNLLKDQDFPGLAKGDTFRIVEPDPDLLSLNLLGSKLIPNTGCASKDYRIFKVLVCTDGYGDVNGDGYIDTDDITRIASLVGESLQLASTQQKIVDGEIDTLELIRGDVDGDGYITVADVGLITDFVARNINSFPVGATFTHMEIQVQQSVGRYDGYFDCDGYVRLDGYFGHNIVNPAVLDPVELVYDGYIKEVSIDGEDSTFATVPFPGVTYQVLAQPFWQDYLAAFSSDARLVPASFTYPDGTIVPANCNPSVLFECTDTRDIEPSCAPGRNDFFVPDNLIIRRGDILRPDGSFYPVDVEIGTVILQLPEVPFEESVINLFDKFVADAGDGFTNGGFRAMKFSDCTTVQPDALARNQVRFSVSIQSFAQTLDGYDDGYNNVTVEDIIGVFLDHSTGIMTLTANDLQADEIFMTLVTKIQVLVYLKKAGWKNEILVVEPSQIEGLFSG